MRLSSSLNRNSDSITSAAIDRARLRLDHEADVLGQLVADVGDQRQLALVEQLGELLDQPPLLHQPRDFGDHDQVGAAAGVFLVPARAHAERAAAGRIGFGDRVAVVDDDAAGRKIRALHVFQQRLRARIRIVDQEQRGIAQLGGIVRRDRGRHADRDALRAVGEQIGERARQHHRLVLGAVIGRPEIDRVLVDAVDQEPRDLGEARLGVAHGGGVIAVDIAEIALPVDQRIALREILRQPYQSVINRLVAVRMEFADDVADHARAFLERGVGIEPQLLHRIKQPPVHRLQPVARIRQRAVHDGRQRIGEIALFQRIAQRDLLDRTARRRRRNQLFAHGPLITAAKRPEQASPQFAAAPARETGDESSGYKRRHTPSPRWRHRGELHLNASDIKATGSTRVWCARGRYMTWTRQGGT